MSEIIKKEEFPSNSINRKERDKLTKVTTGTLIKRRKPFLVRVFGENAGSVGDYILFDVLVPAAKNTISDIISNGIEMLLYGEPRQSNIRRDRGKSYVSYTNYYDKRDKRSDRERIDRNRARHRFDDIIIDTKRDAEEVLSNLVDIVDEYGIATVADFYDLVGLTGDWSDNKYGWDNLSRSSVQRVRDGYILVLPKPYALD